MQDGFLDLSDVKTVRVRPLEVERYRLRSGDVVLNAGGDFDKLGRGTVWQNELDLCLHQNIVLRARVERSQLSPEFLAAITSSRFGRNYFRVASKQSTNIAHLGLAQLGALPVPLAPLRVQRAVCGAVAAHDACLVAEGRRVQKLIDVRRGVLEDLLAGRLLA